MARREINLDEETGRILEEFARECEGGPDEALSGLLHAHKSIESFVEQCEEAHRETTVLFADGLPEIFADYSVSSIEIRIAAISPAAMRQA